jgi:lysophospholipase L1-like esterase
MPLPAGVETVTVSSGEPLTLPDGTWMQGHLEFTGPDLVTIGEDDVVLGGTVKAPLIDGEFSVILCATDATGMSPTGWTYKVESVFTNAPNWTRYITLPKATTSVKLADVLVPDPVAGEYSTLIAAASLGDAALLDVGTVAGTVAAGNSPALWRRRHLPDPVTADALHTGTAPTISTAQTTTPTSGYIKYAPAGVALSGSDVAGPFSYMGAGNFQIGVGTPDSSYVLPLSKYPNTYASGQSVWSVEFGTDAQIIQVRMKYISAATMYRLSIDGRKVTDLMQSSGGIGVGSGHLITIDFGSAAARRLRLDFTTFPFGGVYIPPTATLWGVPSQGGRLMVLGDSIPDGSAQNTGAGAGTWFARTARLLGVTDAWEQGRGGTGYITAGSYATFGTRLAADVIAWTPDRLIISGGYNDSGGDQGAIATAAASLYAATKAGLPNCQVYVIGCWSPTGSPGTGVTNTDTTLRTAAAAAGFPFISPVTGSVYAASGALVATHGAFITTANAASYIGADAIHPNDAGHVYLSRRIAGAIRELMPA